MRAVESVGRKDLALEAWHSAREAAEHAPAGSVIIAVILGTWIPDVLRASDA